MFADNPVMNPAASLTQKAKHLSFVITLNTPLALSLAGALLITAAIELAPGECIGLVIKKRQNNYYNPIINDSGHE